MLEIYYRVKKIITLILIFVSINSYSQTIPNGSFENTDSLGKLTNWKIKSGDIKRVNSTIFFGIPFTANDQFFYLSVQNDSLSTPVKIGQISNSFSLNSAPPTLVFSSFYAPTYSYQKFGVDVLFTKWRNNMRDTILFITNSISPSLDSTNMLLVKWKENRIDLRAGYRDTVIPDSASIIIQSDVVATFSNTTLLLLDNFQFSNWKVSINQLRNQQEFTVFPNPANESVNIKFDLNEGDAYNIKIYDISGRMVKEVRNMSITYNQNEYQMSTVDIPSGLYFIELEGNQFLMHKKFMISHY